MAFIITFFEIIIVIMITLIILMIICFVEWNTDSVDWVINWLTEPWGRGARISICILFAFNWFIGFVSAAFVD